MRTYNPRLYSLGVVPVTFRNAAEKEDGVWYPTDSAISVTGKPGFESNVCAFAIRSPTSQSCGVRPVARLKAVAK